MSSRPTANRIIQAALSSAFALSTTLAMPAGALALTSDTSIVNTGDNAEVETETSHETDVEVTNTNVANITQVFTSSASTGGNSADGNIGGGVGINTGDAISMASFDVEANHSMTGISGLGGNTGVNMLDIVNSGDDAEIDSELENNVWVDVTNTNVANVNQMFTSSASTGGNTADDNIANDGGSVSIQTGDTRSEAEFDVMANENTTALMLGNLNPALGGGTLITNTGDNADVWASSEAETDIEVMNTNIATILQTMTASASTGNNSAEDNVGGVGIASGNATALGEMSADANHNMTGIGGSQSTGSNMNLFDIVNSGDDLEADSEFSTEFEAETTNSNTLFHVATFASSSSTGGNTVDDNISSGLPVWSGNAGAGGSLATDGNHSQTIFGSVADVMMLWMLGSL